MRSTRARRACTRRLVLAVGVGASLLTACSAGGAPVGPPVTVLHVDAPLHEPVWSDAQNAVLALTDDGRVARLAPPATASPDGTTTAMAEMLSAPFADVGENLAPGPDGGNLVYLPQPRLGRLTVVDARTLQPVAALPAGPSPSYVDVDVGSRTVMALSEDRSTVTGVDLHDNTVSTSQVVDRDPEAEIDAGQRGRRIDYYLAGPDGVAFYKGAPSAVREEGRLSVRAEKTAGDLIKSSRLYIAERDTGRVVAVDQTRGLDGLEEVGHADLGQPVRHVGVDETHLYAATDHKLAIFETDTFTGYRNGTIPLVETVDLDRQLPPSLRDTPVSGLTVGRTHVYLTLEDQPFVLSVATPSP